MGFTWIFCSNSFTEIDKENISRRCFHWKTQAGLVHKISAFPIDRCRETQKSGPDCLGLALKANGDTGQAVGDGFEGSCQLKGQLWAGDGV